MAAKTSIQIGPHPLQEEINSLLGRDPTKRHISQEDFAAGMAEAGKEDDDKLKGELKEQGKQLYKLIKERKKTVAEFGRTLQKGDDAISKIYSNLKALQGGAVEKEETTEEPQAAA